MELWMFNLVKERSRETWNIHYHRSLVSRLPFPRTWRTAFFSPFISVQSTWVVLVKELGQEGMCVTSSLQYFIPGLKPSNVILSTVVIRLYFLIAVAKRWWLLNQSRSLSDHVNETPDNLCYHWLVIIPEMGVGGCGTSWTLVLLYALWELSVMTSSTIPIWQIAIYLFLYSFARM